MEKVDYMRQIKKLESDACLEDTVDILVDICTRLLKENFKLKHGQELEDYRMSDECPN